MIHLPYFEKLLSFAIRGLRVTAILGGTLPLFTELPRGVIPGNLASCIRLSRRARNLESMRRAGGVSLGSSRAYLTVLLVSLDAN